MDSVAIEPASASVADAIERHLLASLASELVQGENHQFALAARSVEGELVGGVTARSSYGWLLIRTLWVAPVFRHRGIATSLMRDAEATGRALGCRAVWLHTSNPAARDVCSRLGYEAFGQRENQPVDTPASHRRWFMKKALQPDATD